MCIRDRIRDGQVRITGPDVNHMKNVLRMRPGEEFLVSGGGNDLLCAVESLDVQSVGARILGEQPSRELPAGIWLFQGLPKSDKMELIIQKAVELGAAGIIPVATKNAVVKLDAKKEDVYKRQPCWRHGRTTPTLSWTDRPRCWRTISPCPRKTGSGSGSWCRGEN